MTDEQLKYPIGKFTPPVSYTNNDIHNWINDIKSLPGKLRQVIINLNETQLNTPYRPGGWTLRQVVHHLADSHMNSLMRFKWALTEDSPTIKVYHQASWALLPDYRLPVEPSLRMLEGIHQHLVALFESFTEDQWDKFFIHPETSGNVTLKRNLAMYSWHGKHHLAHITEAIKQF
jgi:hypothetical protein